MRVLSNDGAGGRVVVVIASANRPSVLARCMRDIDQLEGVDERVLSVPDRSSLPGGAGQGDGWRVVAGARGLAAQRNAALDSIVDSPIVFFFDDDASVRSDYVLNAMRFLSEHPKVVGLTGRVILDGAVSGEISVPEAEYALAQSLESSHGGRWSRERELYGCNFAFRISAAPGLRFDARLPLYSWLEDHDFARRLMPYGVLVKFHDSVIVHRAAASGGRQAHRRLGYSQVMNPFYLWRKGSFPLWLMGSEMGKRLAKNLVLAIAGSQHNWRRERLRGNALAWCDILRRRITPERITEL